MRAPNAGARLDDAGDVVVTWSRVEEGAATYEVKKVGRWCLYEGVEHEAALAVERGVAACKRAIGWWRKADGVRIVDDISA